MGMECPNGHGRQAVVLNITPDGSTTAQARDVVARRLACGCVIGGREYSLFLEKLHNIDVDEQVQVEKIRRSTQEARAAAYLGMKKDVEEVE